MDLELTDEQTWLAQSVEQLLAQSPGVETWPALVEFGGLAIASGEDGLGAVELALVGRALGQSLATVPFIETAAARYATRAHASPEHPAFAALHNGEDIVALCLLEPGAGWELVGCATSAKSRSAGATVIEGHKVAVHHADIARELLVLYSDGEDRRLALIERDGAGVKLTPTASIDESLPTAAVGLAGVEVPDGAKLGAGSERSRARPSAGDRRCARGQRSSRSRRQAGRAGARLRRAAAPVRSFDRELPGPPSPARGHARQADERLVDGAVRGGGARRRDRGRGAHGVGRQGLCIARRRSRSRTALCRCSAASHSRPNTPRIDSCGEFSSAEASSAMPATTSA